jgi:hypothetical protein
MKTSSKEKGGTKNKIKRKEEEKQSRGTKTDGRKGEIKRNRKEIER